MKTYKIDDAPIIKLVTCLILDTYKSETKEISFSLKSPPILSIDGEELSPDRDLTKKFINRLKVMSKLSPMKYFKSTEGKILIRIRGEEVDIDTAFLDTKENQTCWLKITKPINS